MDCMAVITDECNLYNAYRESLSRRSYKLSALEFNLDLFKNLGQLRYELSTKTYEISEYNEFYVRYPKLRKILACTFRDKIVQHVMCDNILKKKLPEICIESNCAGQEFPVGKLVDSLIAHFAHASYASEYKQVNYYVQKMEDLAA